VDTRNKLLTVEQAVDLARRFRGGGKRLRVVAGYFDPLLAPHARRLAQLREGAAALAVIVARPPDPILPARARAELVAGLAAADYVVLPGDEPVETILSKLDGVEVLRQESADLEITQRLLDDVHGRQA